MRTVVTGVRDGRSCVVREIDSALDGDSLSMVQLLELNLEALPPRPVGHGEYLDLSVPTGVLRWSRVRFPPDQDFAMHHTDTIDCHTVVAGSVDLILDDGPHRLVAGDGAVVAGVDHAWRSGPDGCETSVFVLGTPKP